jgi:hypothetical protein
LIEQALAQAARERGPIQQQDAQVLLGQLQHAQKPKGDHKHLQ